MIKALAFLFIMQTAAAADLNPLSCVTLLSSKAEASRDQSEYQFKQVIETLRSAGAQTLLEPLDRGEIEPVYKAWRLPWQSMVSGRQSWLGNLSVKVRGLKFKNEREKQKIVWQTATALFELETRANLWSRRSMLAPDDQRKFDLSMEGSDESLAYFMLEQPVEWRDLQIKRLQVLEDELYQVFSSLNLLSADDFLSKKDPGRFWKTKAIYGGDASRSIGPNLEDYEKWRDGQPPRIAQRHGGNLLFNYYMNFMKRAIIVSLAAQVAMAAPELATIPGHLETLFSVGTITQELNSSPEKTTELNRKYTENLQRRVISEEQRLKRAIEREKAKPSPDLSLIQSLEKELADHYESYPWLVTLKR